MKPEEAIRIIEVAKAECEWNAPLECQGAFDAAIEALEKQIPKEPEYKEEDRFAKNYFAWYTYCPQCGCEINTGDMHCTQCGQAIDWEEE